MKNNIDTNFNRAGFSLKNKIGRVLWNFCWVLFFKYSPRVFHEYRSFLLRVFGAKIGKSVHIYPKVRIWAPWHLEVGDHTGVGDYTDIYNQAKITMGSHVTVSQYSYLCTGTHDFNTADFTLITSPIVIEDYAWIAAGCFIHPGITIAKGAVIGAKSVVTKNMPEWMVCTGHPCLPIKLRKFH